MWAIPVSASLMLLFGPLRSTWFDLYNACEKEVKLAQDLSVFCKASSCFEAFHAEARVRHQTAADVAQARCIRCPLPRLACWPTFHTLNSKIPKP